MILDAVPVPTAYTKVPTDEWEATQAELVRFKDEVCQYAQNVGKGVLEKNAEIKALKAALAAREWQPIETKPEEGSGSFLVLLPENGVADYVVLQVSIYEGRMYPDARDACIDWKDGITTATHWQPALLPPKPEGESDAE